MTQAIYELAQHPDTIENSLRIGSSGNFGEAVVKTASEGVPSIHSFLEWRGDLRGS